MRQCKQATLDAFNVLQEQNLDKLHRYQDEEIARIAENFRSEEYRQKCREIRPLIARVEHFAVGIEEGVYDYNTAKALGGDHLIFLDKKVEKIITAARNSHPDRQNAGRQNYYRAFEALAERLEREEREEREERDRTQ